LRKSSSLYPVILSAEKLGEMLFQSIVALSERRGLLAKPARRSISARSRFTIRRRVRAAEFAFDQFGKLVRRFVFEQAADDLHADRHGRLASPLPAGRCAGVDPCLVGTYHRGILAGLRWGTLTKDRDREHWRFTDRAAGEKGDIQVLLIGSIPYENIDNVDWNGDKYYGDPQVYCFFIYKRKEPYEHIGCYEQHIPLSGNALPF
jgi:hypothetical protein